ncbi:MAG: hypothetical protein SGI74_02780 [Oligoflexia bacterium]|nr:hypothetical protein [Oligoflexia bacterium]
MKNLILVIAVILISTQAFAVSNPRNVIMKIYALGVSKNADCSNPTLVMTYPGGKEFDFKNGSSLGGGDVADGTYPCVIMQMSDVIRFVPNVTDGVCVAGTTYTLDVCRAGGGTYTPISNGVFGTSRACTGTTAAPIDDKVLLFLSTTSTNAGGGGGSAFDQPIPSPSVNGFTLNGAFTVAGTRSATFVVNFDNKIDGSGAACDVLPPVFGFR